MNMIIRNLSALICYNDKKNRCQSPAVFLADIKTTRSELEEKIAVVQGFLALSENILIFRCVASYLNDTFSSVRASAPYVKKTILID